MISLKKLSFGRGGRFKQAGFTIVELMIATSVFATVLLVGMAAFSQIGQTYYKGVTITQTSDAATQILNQIAGDIRLGDSVSPQNMASGGRYFYCIGPHRYTFIPYKMVDTSNHDFSTKFGLVEDTLAGSSGCGNPFDTPAVPLVNPTELLGNQMRLLQFNVSAVSGQPGLYTVSIIVAYGQDGVLTSTNSPSAQCKGSLAGGDFCAITRLSTSVYEGI